VGGEPFGRQRECLVIGWEWATSSVLQAVEIPGFHGKRGWLAIIPRGGPRPRPGLRLWSLNLSSHKLERETPDCILDYPGRSSRRKARTYHEEPSGTRILNGLNGRECLSSHLTRELRVAEMRCIILNKANRPGTL